MTKVELWRVVSNAAAFAGQPINDDTATAISRAVEALQQAVAEPPQTLLEAIKKWPAELRKAEPCEVCAPMNSADHAGLCDNRCAAKWLKRKIESLRAEPVAVPSADNPLAVIVRDLRALEGAWKDTDVDDRNALTSKWRNLLAAVAVPSPAPTQKRLRDMLGDVRDFFSGGSRCQLCGALPDDDEEEIIHSDACLYQNIVQLLYETDPLLPVSPVGDMNPVDGSTQHAEQLAREDEVCRCAKPAPLVPGAKCRKCHRWTVAAVNEKTGMMTTVPSNQDGWCEGTAIEHCCLRAGHTGACSTSAPLPVSRPQGAGVEHSRDEFERDRMGQTGEDNATSRRDVPAAPPTPEKEKK